jgi:hypothetical protein
VEHGVDVRIRSNRGSGDRVIQEQSAHRNSPDDNVRDLHTLHQKTVRRDAFPDFEYSLIPCSERNSSQIQKHIPLAKQTFLNYQNFYESTKMNLL